jgi:glycosyltransferase involved in cell wall biosynthesis
MSSARSRREIVEGLAIGRPVLELVRSAPRPEHGNVAILLSTYNGANYLPDQLHSFLAQTHHNWTLIWRDDGSTDNSTDLVRAFARESASGRCRFHDQTGSRQITRSFLSLLAAARHGSSDYFAFSDQDDVWLPDKLARGATALASVPQNQPALYCARRILVDQSLRRKGAPAPLHRHPGFPGALTQNVAPGCTMMLNRAAADIVLSSQPPDTIWHDWWCYVIVAAAGGHILADPTPTVLYRQHDNNWVGEAASWWRRGYAALRRGPGPFMRLFRSHVATLKARPELLPERSRAQLAIIDQALESHRLARVRALFLPGFTRGTWLETFVFWVWFILG